MKISKKDALSWFEFFAQLPEDEDLMESLTLSKDDFKSFKKYNFMLLDPEEY